MSEVKQWSRTDADNDDLSKGGWPPNMDRSDVNDQARDNMGAIRRFVEDGEWVDLTQEDGADFTVERAGIDAFRVVDASGANASSKFLVGSWCRVTGTGGTTVAYGSIKTSLYSDPNLTVTLENIVDAAYATSDLPSTTVDAVACYFNRLVRQGAFHHVGVVVGQVPAELMTVDALSDPLAIAQLNTAELLDAATLGGLEPSAFQLVGGAARNSLANGAMAVWQREIAFIKPTDDTYVADRWNFLAEADLWDVHREDSILPDGFRRSLRLTANTTTSAKVGIVQVLTGEDTVSIVGNGKASLSYYVLLPMATGFARIRAAILEWSGVEDAVTSDVVAVVGAQWSAEGTDPVLATSWAYANTPSADEHLAASDWTRVTVEDVDIASGTKNLAVFIWIEDKTFIDGSSAYITGVQLEAGSVPTPYRHTPFSEDLALCLPYYQKTYDYGVHPGDPSAAGRIEFPLSRIMTPPVMSPTAQWRFHVPMFKVPSMTVYAPGTGTSGKVTGSTTGDINSSVVNPGTGGATLLNIGVSVVEEVSAHITAEAEL